LTYLFNRTVELRVYTTIKVFTIRELDFEFRVDLNCDSTPNIAKITVYNLSEKTRNLLSEDHQGVELYAGYNADELPVLLPGTLPQIFKGHTINVSHYKDNRGVSWVTEILAGDGNQEFLESYFSKSYRKGTPIQLLFLDLAKEFGLPFTTDFTDASALMARGQTFAGKVKDILTEVTDDYFLSWSFQNQTLEIVNLNNPPLKDLAVTIFSPDTGLIGNPVMIERPAAQKKKKVNKGAPKKKPDPPRVGVRLESLLMGEIKPGRLFKVIPAIPASGLGIEALKRKGEIKLPSVTTVYIADTVSHTGSNFGQDYSTSIEGDIYIP